MPEVRSVRLSLAEQRLCTFGQDNLHQGQSGPASAGLRARLSMLYASVFAGPPALQSGNVARALLAEIDVRLPFLLRLLAAISIPLVAQDTKNWRNPPQRDSQATISVTADLVLVPVTVTESSGKPVLGLEKQDFVLTDDKAAQNILSFSREIAPVSIGIVFDLSGSMSNKIGKARTAVREFLRYLETGDEVFLVTFNDNAQQRTEFASEDAAVLNELLFARPAGSTALLDAVALAVRAMRKAQNDRRVLLVISDGEDNHSRLSERELKRILEETEIQIHALGIHDRSPGMGTAAGPKVLEDLAQMTGGEHHMVNDAGELPGLAAQMGLSLHDRYLLGYRPTPPGQPGKWRRIRVRLPGAPRSYQVYARTGYRTP